MEAILGFTPEQVRNLRRGVIGVLGFGITTSIAANVLHSIVQPRSDGFGELKLAFALFLAGLAPVVLFVCIELVTRIPSFGIVHTVLAWVRLIATIGIGGFAGWVSYWHMVDICVLLGESDGINEYLYPAIIDGMMAVATISLIAVGALKRAVEAHAAATTSAQAAAAQAAAEAEARRAAARAADEVSEEEELARKRAGYYSPKWDSARRADFTRKWRAKRAAEAAKEARRAAKAQSEPQPTPPAPPAEVPADRQVDGSEVPDLAGVR